MTRSTLFDRLNQELEAFGKKAQAALDEGKLQIELMRVRRKRDSAARDLGLLVHKRERGSDIEPRRTDALLLKLDGLEAELARLAGQLDQARRERPSRSAASQPPTGPSGAPTQANGEPTSTGAEPTQASNDQARPGAEPTQPAAGASA
jgi:hypothetical protein